MAVNITGTFKFKKSNRKTSVPLLPGDAILLKQIEQEQKKSRVVATQLENLGPVDVEWQKSKTRDMLGLLDSILERMWTPIPENYGYEKTLKLEAERRSVPAIVMTSHLYGIFSHNTTLVDRTLAACQRQKLLHLLKVEVSGINEMIIAASKFEHPLAPLLEKTPESTWFSAKDLEDYDVPKLVREGYVTISPAKPGVHTIAYPRQGAMIRLVIAGRNWITKTLRATKWKELSEGELEDKLERSTGFWKNLQGISLEWILYDAVGTGLVEPFATPIGRGWKLC